jgi:HK97 family phage prohead protease
VTTKDFKLEIKSVEEDGTFEGYLSVFDVVDLTGDLVEKGAFGKTIKEHPDGIVMLWQHDPSKPIGKMFLTEDDYGLKVKGVLALGVSQAQEAYTLLKAGIVRWMSIGYKAIKKEMVDGIRRLKEVKLFEGSVVTFPALPLAQITAVKAEDMDGRKDFLSELNRIQVFRLRDMMLSALSQSLDEIIYGYGADTQNLTADQRVTASEASIDQFRAAYMQHLPKLLELWGVKSEPMEAKAGRRISATTRAHIEEAITKLQALLSEETNTQDEETEPSKSDAGAASSKSAEPEFHSLLSVFDKFSLKEINKWN